MNLERIKMMEMTEHVKKNLFGFSIANLNDNEVETFDIEEPFFFFYKNDKYIGKVSNKGDTRSAVKAIKIT